MKLDGNRLLTGASLTGLEIQFPQLEILDISRCFNLTDTGLVNLLQMSGNKIRDLNLSNIRTATGDSLGGLGLQFPQLETLDKSAFVELTNTGLVNLLQMSGNKLMHLDIFYCYQVSEEGLRKLKMISKGQLTTLNCRGIPAMSYILEEELKEHFPGCDVELDW